MDELAKKLSILSFGVIGIICVIGVLQSRSWLDMFTIGGTARSSHPKPLDGLISLEVQCPLLWLQFRKDFRSSLL